MPNYLVMIYDSEAQWAEAGPEALTELMEAHNTFAANNARYLRGGNQLTGGESATSIRADGAGGFAVTDGTFAETKEVLGGYYLIEAADLDEALAVAKQVPARFGGVEVRPIVDR